MADNTFNPINYVGFQNPLAALKLQQQQALATELMADSQPRKDINATIGTGPYARVAQYSPFEGLSKALEAGASGYLQRKNTEELANALQSQSGTAQSDSSSPTMQERYAEALQPGMGKTMLEARLKSQYAGPTKAAETAVTPQNFNGHIRFITPPGASGASAANSAPAPNSGPNPSGAMPQAQQNQAIDEVFGNPEQSASPGPVNLVAPNGKENVDWNNPAAVKGAESEAEKSGQDAADIGKTLTVMQSNLPMVLERFEKMRGAAKDASYGFGTTQGEDGSPPPLVAYHDMVGGAFGDKTAEANGIIQQTSAQGVLPELGPTLAQAGIKGNKFLETLSSNASAIPLHQAPNVKLNTINGLETQYINNLKSTAAQARKYGDKSAPTDAQIDEAVARTRSKGKAPETKVLNGVTYTKINGQWHQ